MECAAMAAKRGTMAGTSNRPRFSSPSITRLAANSSYYDRSHLQYYGGAVKVYCGKKTKLEKQAQKGLSALHDGSLSDKRRMKLLELVSRDLSALSNTFAEGKDADKPSLAEDVRGEIFSGALQVLTTQLEQLKTERRQRKKEMKAQKKAQKKLQKKGKDDSSSSSESNNSDCEVVDVAQLRMTQPTNVSMIRLPEPPPVTGDDEAVVSDAISAVFVENPTNMAGLHREFAETKERLRLGAVELQGCRQVQVCMGGKCKKLGSEQLLTAFEESIQNSGMGSAIEAVGCKCMGKCRSAPNVKVQNDFRKELHMGVGVEDVDLVLDRHVVLKAQENDLKSKELIQI